MALFYNFGFFTLLAYTPFPLHLGAHELGFVFFGWGLLVAIFSVFVAPAAKRRLGTVGTLAAVFALFAADLLIMALAIGTPDDADRRAWSSPARSSASSTPCSPRP